VHGEIQRPLYAVASRQNVGGFDQGGERFGAQVVRREIRRLWLRQRWRASVAARGEQARAARAPGRRPAANVPQQERSARLWKNPTQRSSWCGSRRRQARTPGWGGSWGRLWCRTPSYPPRPSRSHAFHEPLAHRPGSHALSLPTARAAGQTNSKPARNAWFHFMGACLGGAAAIF